MGDLPRLGFPPLLTAWSTSGRSRAGGIGNHSGDELARALASDPAAGTAVRVAALRLPRPALLDWTEVASRSVLLSPGEVTMTTGSATRIRVDPDAQDFAGLPVAYRGNFPWDIESSAGDADAVEAVGAIHCNVPKGKGPTLDLLAVRPGTTTIRFIGCGPGASKEAALSQVVVTVVDASSLRLRLHTEMAGDIITDGDTILGEQLLEQDIAA